MTQPIGTENVQADDAPIAIVGMGPAGLVAAIDAAKKGYPIQVFENRKFFTRPQKIFPDQNTMRYLQGLATTEQDRITLEKIEKLDENGVRVRTIQKYLYRKLKELEAANPERVKLIRDPSLSFNAIDHGTQALSYEVHGEHHTLQCSHIIEADGAGRHLLSVLNQNDEHNIQSVPFAVQPRHMSTGTGQLVFSDEMMSAESQSALQKLEGVISWTYDDFAELKAFGWDKPYFPNALIYVDSSQKKISFATEMPDIFLNNFNFQDEAERRKQGEDFFNFLLKKKIQGVVRTKPNPDLEEILNKKLKIAEKRLPNGATEEEKARVRSINALNLTTFELNLSYVDKPFANLGQGGKYLFVGDSLESPYFYGSHGLNDAIKGARNVVQFLPNPGTAELFNEKEYIAFVDALKENEELMLAFENETSAIDKYTYFVDFLDDRYLKIVETYLNLEDPVVQANLNKIEMLRHATTCQEILDGMEGFESMNDLIRKSLAEKPSSNKAKIIQFSEKNLSDLDEFEKLVDIFKSRLGMSLRKGNPAVTAVSAVEKKRY